MKEKILLAVGGLLIAFAVVKPETSWLRPLAPSIVIDNSVINNIDSTVKGNAAAVTEALKHGSLDRRSDGKRLASLYSDLATLIALDGDNEVVKTTEDIKQANSLAGLLLKLDLKGKYPDLSPSCTNLIKSMIGDDNAPLDKELRAKSVEAFKILAWACNEGSK
jgi:hypothetical protein